MTSSSNSSIYEPRGGLFTRIGRWFRRRGHDQPTVTTPQPNVPVSVVRTGDPIVVPADGGAFDFTVHYELTWSAKGMLNTTLNNRVDGYLESAARTMRNTIWPIGRRHMPHQIEAAEQEMNEALRHAWCYDDSGEVVSCQAAVRVIADERVITRQRPIWEQVVELGMRHRFERQRLEYVEDMLARWRDLLDDFGDSPVAVHAAQLVDEDVAEVLSRLAKWRNTTAWNLVTVLRETRDVYGQIGLFELAESYDVAVRSFERAQGLRPGSSLENAEAEKK